MAKKNRKSIYCLECIEDLDYKIYIDDVYEGSFPNKAEAEFYVEYKLRTGDYYKKDPNDAGVIDADNIETLQHAQRTINAGLQLDEKDRGILKETGPLPEEEELKIMYRTRGDRFSWEVLMSGEPIARFKSQGSAEIFRIALEKGVNADQEKKKKKPWIHKSVQYIQLPNSYKWQEWHKVLIDGNMVFQSRDKREADMFYAELRLKERNLNE